MRIEAHFIESTKHFATRIKNVSLNAWVVSREELAKALLLRWRSQAEANRAYKDWRGAATMREVFKADPGTDTLSIRPLRNAQAFEVDAKHHDEHATQLMRKQSDFYLELSGYNSQQAERFDPTNFRELPSRRQKQYYSDKYPVLRDEMRRKSAEERKRYAKKR